MKPEKILESDMLDIIFENRNKEYGAYELRKHYNSRAGKAMGVTIMIVLAFGLMQSFKVPKKTGRVFLEGPVVLIADMPKAKVEEKKKEVKQEVQHKTVQTKKLETVQLTKPIIVANIEPIKPMATVTQIEDKIIDTKTAAGLKGTPGILETPFSTGGGDAPGSGEGKGKEEIAPEGPIYIAEVMPQFPGGKEAFMKFMQRNLRQPDDMEEGQKVVVIAKFVVNAEGEIVDIDITQNGRKDLDEEVVRVIKKMPRWNPGMQNGRKVAVFYKVPVTFVAP